jgi:DNA primase
MRFLFLPDGHDPDTLVGEEGREAFEERLASAIPLSEYLVRELTDQTDLSHADGRARFAAAARPLLAKVPQGVYRELLLARIAEAVGLPPQRLDELWNAGAKPAPQPEAPVQRPPARVAVSAGRGSLVRQAVTRLLWYPAIATQVTDAERAALDRVTEPGIELLRELIDNLRENPAQLPAQVIERWADRPEAESLQKLLQKEEVITKADAAATELRAALVSLVQREDKKLEFERLTSRGGPR